MRLKAFAITLLPALAAAPAFSADQGLLPAAATRAAEASVANGQPPRSSTAKTQPKATPKGALKTQEAAPFNPRWVAPKVQMKGLVVWVFTPGHFQRD